VPLLRSFLTRGRGVEQAAATKQTGATWADVVITALTWAREEPVSFCAVLAFTALIIWLLFPRATRLLQSVYTDKMLEHRRKKEKPDEPELPLGGSDA
jgi:hypothetical protein